MYCQTCGEKLAPDARFCPRCGASSLDAVYSERTQLAAFAIPAGVCFVLYILVTVLQSLLLGGTPIGVSHVLYAAIAVLLFSSVRNGIYPVLFGIAALVSLYWTVVSYFEYADLPYYLFDSAMTLTLIGMAVVCFRRRKRPARGPWWLALLPLAVYLAFVVGMGVYSIVNLLAVPEYAIPAFATGLGVAADVLILPSFLFTLLAFVKAPKKTVSQATPEIPVTEPEPQPQPDPEPASEPEPQPEPTPEPQPEPEQEA